MRARHRSTVSPRPAVVYIAKAKKTDSHYMYKIGCSTNLGERLNTLRSPWGTPVTLVDVAHVGFGTLGESFARAVEAGLHQRYDARRLVDLVDPKSGHRLTEWFALKPAEVNAFHEAVAEVKWELVQEFAK
jgi:hypothetical protein